MLDTNLCIRVLRDRPALPRERFNPEADGALRLHDRSDAVRLEVLKFDDATAAHAAEIRGQLERRDQAIGGYDTLIAGHARSRGLVRRDRELAGDQSGRWVARRGFGWPMFYRPNPG